MKDGVRNFQSFLKEGLIEYLDVNDENNALIALYEENAREETTHIEIEPFTILGVIAGLIPYPHHNQSPRNTYQCAMGKQAMGNIAYNQAMSYLPDLYVLSSPTYLEIVRLCSCVGAGQNASVAVMSYSGYDIEDAIVMNKSSLDRGFGRCIVMKKLVAINQKYANGTSDRIIRPQRDGHDAEQTQILDDDGLASPGEIIRPRDIYINKQSPIDTKNGGSISNTVKLKDSQYKSSKQTYKGTEGDTAVVDRVALCTDKNSNLCIKYMIRSTRRPEVGDKFSSRHGQKGVCGTIVQQEAFPFSERGVCPDLIMNPHGFPRVTIGMKISGWILGMFTIKAFSQEWNATNWVKAVKDTRHTKVAVSSMHPEVFHYGSAFGEPSGHTDKVETISETLVKHGFSYNGKDLLYSLFSNQYIYFVLDKMHARGNGPRVMMTRQPTEGRSKNGGLRVGEMERDCLIAYGASMLLHERLMLSSDPFEVQVCRKCGLMGYYNEKLKTGICSMCKNGENISTMKMPYACKLLFQELQSMNIVPRLKLTDV
ncbi:hypothetical protein SASPL_137423 [Salvia splendens]|uniref:DNA-directed RNA polymerase n=1 Tax=Salvia splendens TaxID=180675 RepID=A0A8X8WTB3_SALSN|nr:hypothetical protein SASPL_137423 [Salvia splendens]